MLAFIPHKEGDHLVVPSDSDQAHCPEVHRPAVGRDSIATVKLKNYISQDPLPCMVLR